MVKANSQYLTQGWAKGLGVATSFCCISKRRAPRGRPPGTLYCVGHACKTPGRYNFPGNVYFRCGGSLGPTTSANFSTGYRRTGDFARTGITPKGPWFGVVQARVALGVAEAEVGPMPISATEKRRLRKERKRNTTDLTQEDRARASKRRRGQLLNMSTSKCHHIHNTYGYI